MPTTLQVVFDCADPARQAAFWVEALGYRLPDPPAGFADWNAWAAAQGIPEERWNDARAIEDPAGVRPRVFFQKVPEGKTAKNRVHLDVGVSGGHDVPIDERRRRVDAEVARLKALGATDGRGPMDRLGEYWVRMNDPEGNEFCVQ
jgi:catechol 2,3-dioxygenase-like lactoylglutathione lyase family enzyme